MEGFTIYYIREDDDIPCESTKILLPYKINLIEIDKVVAKFNLHVSYGLYLVLFLFLMNLNLRSAY